MPTETLALVGLSDEPTFATDEDLRVLVWNDAAASLFGIPPDEAEGCRFDELITFGECGTSFGAIHKELEKYSAWHGEVPLISRHGRRVTVLLTVRRVMIPEEGLNGFFFSFHSLLTQKRFDLTQLQSDRRYQILSENITDVIWVRDLNMKTLYISPSVERQTGYTVAEAMRLEPTDILTPESVVIAQQVVSDGLATGNLEQTTLLEHVHKDGHRFWVEICGSFIFDDNGNPTGMLGVSRDVTRRGQAEQQLRETNRCLEAALRELRAKTEKDASDETD